MQGLKDHYLDSTAINFSIDFHRKISISRLFGVPKQLLVRTLAALD